MITTPTMYGLKCDNCKTDFENFVGYTCTDESSAFVDDALESGWHEADSEQEIHYCPECFKLDIDDDGNEFIIINANRTKQPMNHNTQPIADLMDSSVSRLTALLSPSERLNQFQSDNVTFEGKRYLMGAYIDKDLIFALNENTQGLISISFFDGSETRLITKEDLMRFPNFEKAWGVH